MNKATDSYKNFLIDLKIRQYYNYDSIYSLYEDLDEFDTEELFEKLTSEMLGNVKIIHEGIFENVSSVEYHRRFGWVLNSQRSCAYLGKISFQNSILINIGNQSYISGRSSVAGNGKLNIGCFCSIADGVEFITSSINHPMNFASTFNFSSQARLVSTRQTIDLMHYSAEKSKLDSERRNIDIGNDVWIGKNSTLFNGITIGDGAVVGAGSIVTKNLDSYGVYAGNPAKLIRYRFSEEIIEALLEIKWWNWSYENLIRNRNFLDTDFSKYSGDIHALIR